MSSRRLHHSRESVARASTPLADVARESQSAGMEISIDSLGEIEKASAWALQLTPDELQRMQDVLARRSGTAGLEHAVVAELVAVVLPHSLTSLVEGPRGRERLANRVARTLLDDPVSAARLQKMIPALNALGVMRSRAAPGASDL